MRARSRRWLTLALAPLVATVFLVAAPTSAGAAPGTPSGAAPGTSSGATEDDDDPLLSQLMDDTGRRYIQAKNEAARSTKAQLTASLQLRSAEAERERLLPSAGQVASASYRTGSLSALGFLLNSTSSETFLQRAVSLNEINEINDQALRDYNIQVDRAAAAKQKLDQEIAAERAAVAAMARQKKAADKAFALIGGESLTHGFVEAKSPEADPAPRNADGGFDPESCSVDDPTTDGCITPRTYHMYKEVKKAGFNRFVGCHRNGGPFEHPKGRACDWSLQKSGFSVAHNADMKKYGNDLMAFLVRNADRLGILYVIWFAQVWFPSRGWSTYHGPSNHKDHVHVSML